MNERGIRERFETMSSRKMPRRTAWTKIASAVVALSTVVASSAVVALSAVVAGLLAACGSSSATWADEPAGGGFTCVEDRDGVTLKYGGDPVLRYNKTVQPAPEGIDPVYERSGYIHPIWTPSGRVVTGDFAADHPHQHGLFFAFVKTTFDGREIDFWNQRAGTGRIAHEAVKSIEPSGERAGFVVTQLHQDITGGATDAANPDGVRDVLRETWTVRGHEAVAGGSGHYVVDIESRLECVADSPLRVETYHYGGLAIRGAIDLFRPRAGSAFRDWTNRGSEDADRSPPGIDVMGHEFLTSQGKRRHDGNHTRADWVDLSGVIEGEPAGIAIVGHPDNFRSPQPVRLNPAKPYFCFAPMVESGFEIAPGEPFVSRFRLVVHDGPAEPAILDAAFTGKAAR